MRLHFTLDIIHYKVVEFYPYTSIVTNILIQENSNSIIDTQLHDLFNKFMEEAVKLGFKPDNKTVIGIKNITTDTILYIGNYDNKISLGLTVLQR